MTKDPARGDTTGRSEDDSRTASQGGGVRGPGALALAERLLRDRYRGHDAFVRQVGDRWSAEVVAAGQWRPPYRTVVIAEAPALDALIAALGGPAAVDPHAAHSGTPSPCRGCRRGCRRCRGGTRRDPLAHPTIARARHGRSQRRLAERTRLRTTGPGSAGVDQEPGEGPPRAAQFSGRDCTRGNRLNCRTRREWRTPDVERPRSVTEWPRELAQPIEIFPREQVGGARDVSAVNRGTDCVDNRAPSCRRQGAPGARDVCEFSHRARRVAGIGSVDIAISNVAALDLSIAPATRGRGLDRRAPAAPTRDDV